MKLKINKNNKTERVIIILLLFIIGGGIFYHLNKIGKKNDQYEQQVKLTEALTDSIRIYETKNDELIYEKRTIQGDLSKLQKENFIFSEEQKDLLETVERINKERRKEREIFAAARITYEAFIDSLNEVIAGATNIDTINNVISFVNTDTGGHFIYDLDIMNVRPYPFKMTPEIRFKKIDFPNKQIVTFNWDKNKRKDYPISFSVMNTNKYYKPLDIESFAIEGLNKDTVKPTGWKKAWNWVKINGKYVLVGAAGFVIGATVVQ